MAKSAAIYAIKIYQIFISPFLGQNCRFYPNCSKYCVKAVEKYGAGKGFLLGLKRVLRCNPWNKGGVDEI